MADDDAPFAGALLVATPAAADPVNEASDDEHAHVTLLWFGEAEDLPPAVVEEIRDHAAAVASDTEPFTAKVSGRAILGAEDAGVLLLESEVLAALREDLFDHPTVRDAYLSTTQFPHWVPHCTLRYGKGLPDPPAFTEITFDAAGLWLGGQHESFAFGSAPTVADASDGLAAAGLTIPPVIGLDDLPLCVSFAVRHPDARWYAERRARALGRADLVPDDWAVA